MTRARLEQQKYEEQKAQAAAADKTARLRLAQEKATAPEILYYLAEDAEAEVRQAAARNNGTPHQADLILARDLDAEVRADVARKIARLAPTLTTTEQERVRDLVFEILRVLAEDQLPRIRAILADTLKAERNVPHEVMLRLARDAEAMVANPVLEFSPLLTDEDLLLVIEEGQAAGRLTAMARRQGVSAVLADALAATLDETAVAALLANPSAQIREETLDALVEEAPSRTGWHAPLTLRPLLPLRIAERLVKFISDALLERLLSRHDLGPDLPQKLRSAVEARRAEAVPEDKAHTALSCDDETIEAACLSDDRDGIMRAIALKTLFPIERVLRIFASGSARGVTALSWKAGLSMRTGIRLQLRIARIPAAKTLNARNGTDYPLTPQEMEEALTLFQ